MTTSSTDNKSGDGEVAAGPSIDELFSDVAEEPLEEGALDRTVETQYEDVRIEDRTATDVFTQLRDEASTDSDVADVLDETPEEIIASADRPDPDETGTDDADLLADEDALDDLLLTGRTKEDEFLWIDSATSGESSDRSESVDTGVPADGLDDDTDLESTPEETSLALQADEQLPATIEEDSDADSGFLAWLRSKLPF